MPSRMHKFLKVWSLAETRQIGVDPKTPPSIDDVSSMVEMYLGFPKHLYIDGVECIVEMEYYYDTFDCQRYRHIIITNSLLLADLEIRVSHSGQTAPILHSKPKQITVQIHEFMSTESRKRKFGDEIAVFKTSTVASYLRARIYTRVPLTFYHLLKTAHLKLGIVQSCRHVEGTMFLLLFFYESNEAQTYAKLLEESPLLLNELEFRLVVKTA